MKRFLILSTLLYGGLFIITSCQLFFPPAFYDKIVVNELFNTNTDANPDVPVFESFLTGDLLFTNQSILLFEGKVSIGTNFTLSKVHYYKDNFWYTNMFDHVFIDGPLETIKGRNIYRWAMSNTLFFNANMSNSTFLVKAIGSTGKEGYSRTNYIVVDTIDPSPQNLYPAFGSTVGSPLNIFGSAFDSLSGVKYVTISIDGGMEYPAALDQYTNFSFVKDISLLTQGSHYYNIVAYDRAGNSNNTPIQVNFTYSDAMPSALITSPGLYTMTGVSNINLTIKADINNSYSISSINLVVNDFTTNFVGNYGSANLNITTPYNLIPGVTNKIVAMVIGSTGQTNFSAPIYAAYDNVAPTIFFNNLTTGQTIGGVVYTVDGYAFDSLSGVGSIYLSLNGGPFNVVSTTSNFSFNLNEGTYSTISVYAVDKAGNTGMTQIVSNVNLVSSVHVSPSGNDVNPGTKASPVRSLQRAVDIAGSFAASVTIKVAQGTYSPGSGLNIPASTNNYSGVFITNGNLQILGGYDAGFNTRSGRSFLDGQASLSHVITLQSNSLSTIDGFILANGNAVNGGDMGFGGGLFLRHSTSATITNCLISNNTAVSNGGGVYIDNLSSYNTLYCEIGNNNAKFGGGVAVHGYGNNIYSKIFKNQATDSGGGLYIENADSTTVNSSIYFNTCFMYGGGLFLKNSGSATIYGTISTNSAGSSGGGLYSDSTFSTSTFHTTNLNNTAFFGGSTYINGGSGWVLEGYHANNISSNSGSAFYIIGGSGSAIQYATIINNKAQMNNGNAIHLNELTNLTILDSIITNNISFTTNTNTIYINMVGVPITITNNRIGGGGPESTGIYMGTGTSMNSLVGNTFVTNSLRYLLYYQNGVFYVTNNSTWTAINNPAFFNTTTATNNTVTTY